MNIFGKVKIGYLVAESNKFDEWIDFAQKCLGLCLAEHTEQSLSFRLDEFQKRLIITKGSQEDVTHLGVQLADEAVLNEVLSRFDVRGIEYQQGSPVDAEFRGVKAFWTLRGPKDIQLEIFVDELRTELPLEAKVSGFYTDASGMGHVAMTSRKPEKVIRFWQEFFDARLTDRIEQKISGVILDVSFLRLNERHHSVAIAHTRGLSLDPIRTRIQHVNFQVLDLEDVTASYQRCKDYGFHVVWDVGLHTNDREVSFYVASPSGFEVELGWNPIKIDEMTWKPTKHTSISVWGHKPRQPSAVHGLMHELGNFNRGLQSLKRDEYSPI
ncbi:extradiol ring-cleavage dioxygenase [Acinetobacter sp. ANC 5054]|uniref:VOC family protein n=1 Tax=Acinetobacter sp. ANC 5054 TaxID=1977877 RepID=UPI000A3378AB|nr:VOC family protein [Acinetobacter sp. ANC 5054]OTG79677.1 extradiol ring-cleavage dioxygenase [Acinetobacter sp. ANC 5054]